MLICCRLVITETMPYSVMLLKTWERLIKQEGLMKFRKFVAKVKDMEAHHLPL